MLSQLEYSGVIAFLNLLNSGYPSRVNVKDLYEKFKPFLPAELVDKDAKKVCLALLQSMGWKQECRVGKTKVFFQIGQFSVLDQLMKSNEADMRLIINSYKASNIRSKWSNITTCLIYYWRCMCQVYRTL